MFQLVAVKQFFTNAVSQREVQENRITRKRTAQINPVPFIQDFVVRRTPYMVARKVRKTNNPAVPLVPLVE